MIILIGSCLLLHILVGFFIKPYLEGDEILYVGMSRQMASSLDHSIMPLTWYEGVPQNSLIPNFVYPAILATFQLAHQFDSIRFLNILFQSISLVAGSLVLYAVARSVDKKIGTREAAFLILASNLYPYSNFSGYFVTEPVYYTAFYLFVLIVVIVIQKKGCQIINIGEDIAIGVILALIYYVKISLLWALPIYAFTFLLFFVLNHGSRQDLLISLKSCALAATSWGITLLIINNLVGQSLLGAYGPVLAVYNLRDLPDVLLTWLGQSLFLFSYSAFLVLPALLAAGYEVWRRWRGRRTLPARSIVFLLTAISFLVIPTILAVHSVSHIESGYERRDWYIFQERVYGFMIPLFFLNIVLYRNEIGRFISLRTLVLIACFVATYVYLENRTLEPYSARITGIAFALPQVLHIEQKYVIVLPLFLFAVICLLANITVHKHRHKFAVVSGVSQIALIGLLCVFKFAHAAYVISFNVEDHKNASEISSYLSKAKSGILFMLREDVPIVETLFLTRDNRLDYKVLSSWNDIPMSTWNTSTPKTLLLSTAHVNAAIFDQESSAHGTPNGTFFVPSLNILSVLGAYRNPDTKATLPLIGGSPSHLQRSETDIYPWIELLGPAAYKMHPSDDLDVGIVMTNPQDEPILVYLFYEAQMMENTARTNGVLIRVETKGGGILDESIVEGNGIPVRREVTFLLLPREQVSFFANSRGNADYDATIVKIGYTSTRLSSFQK